MALELPLQGNVVKKRPSPPGASFYCGSLHQGGYLLQHGRIRAGRDRSKIGKDLVLLDASDDGSLGASKGSLELVGTSHRMRDRNSPGSQVLIGQSTPSGHGRGGDGLHLRHDLV